MQRIRKGDEIIVIAGKDKGRRGTVLRIDETDRLVVEGVNVAKKHQKPNPAMNQAGGIVEKESPIHVSNVALYNPGIGKGDRVSFRTLDDGRKVRIFKSTDEAVDI